MPQLRPEKVEDVAVVVAEVAAVTFSMIKEVVVGLLLAFQDKAMEVRVTLVVAKAVGGFASVYLVVVPVVEILPAASVTEAMNEYGVFGVSGVLSQEADDVAPELVELVVL